MIWEYLAGELSVLLEKLQAATDVPAGDLASLRHRVEDGPAAELDAELARALAAADRLCWDSLARGDIDAFARQSSVCADLHTFGTCARLIDDC
jgi:hypothetical protein